MDTITAPVEIRDAESGSASPGILSGVLLRYGETGQHGRELFAPGALEWPDNGIRVDVEHLSSPVKGRIALPLMRTIPTVEGNEVRIEAPLPATTAARDVAALMRMTPPAFQGLSVEFRATREHRDGRGRRVIDKGLLTGAGLVETPSYSTSVEVRSDAPRRVRVWL